ncbi:TRAP transporter small permease [Arenibacterium sp. LLYu02]|uniref:TRAP transporter small permease n=1 Tax=Arenibacterium sp. LLYu02 TaxID=3404132 RepID=UPI003B2232C8
MQAAGWLWGRLVDALFAIAATYLVLIVVATIFDVVARNTALHAPLWISTFVEYGLPIATMFAAPKLVRDRTHVAMELIDSVLSNFMRRNLIRFTDIAAAGVCVVVAWYASQAGLTAAQRGEVVFLAVNVPRWLLYAVLAIGFSFCAVEFLRHLVRSFGRDGSEPEVRA